MQLLLSCVMQVSALKACLEDSAVLVQRNTLDILSIAFPFHDSQLTRADQSEVISSALLVLLRRDMSLNRRLYAWLLGVTAAGNGIAIYHRSIEMQCKDAMHCKFAMHCNDAMYLFLYCNLLLQYRNTLQYCNTMLNV